MGSVEVTSDHRETTCGRMSHDYPSLVVTQSSITVDWRLRRNCTVTGIYRNLRSNLDITGAGERPGRRLVDLLFKRMRTNSEDIDSGDVHKKVLLVACYENRDWKYKALRRPHYDKSGFMGVGC